jgi:hypothetical protein
MKFWTASSGSMRGIESKVCAVWTATIRSRKASPNSSVAHATMPSSGCEAKIRSLILSSNTYTFGTTALFLSLGNES